MKQQLYIVKTRFPKQVVQTKPKVYKIAKVLLEQVKKEWPEYQSIMMTAAGGQDGITSKDSETGKKSDALEKKSVQMNWNMDLWTFCSKFGGESR